MGAGGGRARRAGSVLINRNHGETRYGPPRRPAERYMSSSTPHFRHLSQNPTFGRLALYVLCKAWERSASGPGSQRELRMVENCFQESPYCLCGRPRGARASETSTPRRPAVSDRLRSIPDTCGRVRARQPSILAQIHSKAQVVPGRSGQQLGTPL